MNPICNEFALGMCKLFLEPLTEAIKGDSREQQSKKVGISVKTLEGWFKRKSRNGEWIVNQKITRAYFSNVLSMIAAYNATFSGNAGARLTLAGYRQAIEAEKSSLVFSDQELVIAILFIHKATLLGDDPSLWNSDDETEFLYTVEETLDLLNLPFGYDGNPVGKSFKEYFDQAKPLLVIVAMINEATKSSGWIE